MRAIEVIQRGNVEPFKRDVNQFLADYPDAKILALFPRGIEAGKGFIAVIEYTRTPVEKLVKDEEYDASEENELKAKTEDLGEIEKSIRAQKEDLLNKLKQLEEQA
jgi:hypothetical protein